MSQLGNRRDADRPLAPEQHDPAWIVLPDHLQGACDLLDDDLFLWRAGRPR
jgi:hypothetical protein